MVPAGRGATAFVDGEDVGAVAAAALLDPLPHHNKAWTITGGEALTYDQVARILTAELGRPTRYARPGIFHYLRHARRTLGIPWGMVVVTAAIYSTARLGIAGGLSGTVRELLGRDPISFADFVHRERDIWKPHPYRQGERMRIALLGASGRTGVLTQAQELGHQVIALVRDPGSVVTPGVLTVEGDVRDPAALDRIITDADAVTSAVGARGRTTDLHTVLAQNTIKAMKATKVGRFDGISVGGLDVPGDRKGPRDRLIGALARTLAGAATTARLRNLQAWQASTLKWTLIRDPRPHRRRTPDESRR